MKCLGVGAASIAIPCVASVETIDKPTLVDSLSKELPQVDYDISLKNNKITWQDESGNFVDFIIHDGSFRWHEYYDYRLGPNIFDHTLAKGCVSFFFDIVYEAIVSNCKDWLNIIRDTSPEQSTIIVYTKDAKRILNNVQWSDISYDLSQGLLSISGCSSRGT